LIVDEQSLIKSGPVRVKLNCRDPNKLRGFVRIFFNTMGHDIRFVSEKYKEKSVHPPPLHLLTEMKTQGKMRRRRRRRRRTLIVTGNIGRGMLKHTLDLIKPWKVRKEGLLQVTTLLLGVGRRKLSLLVKQLKDRRRRPEGGE
jgi:hypothetical protein